MMTYPRFELRRSTLASGYVRACRATVCSLVALAAALSAPGRFARATTYSWNGPTAYYDEGSAWSPGGGPPGPLDAASFYGYSAEVRWDSITGNRSVSQVNVELGGIILENRDAAPRYTLEIGHLEVRNIGGLNVHGLNVRVGDALLLNGGLTVDGSHSAGSSFHVTNSVNLESTANSSSGFEVLAGGVMTADAVNVGFNAGNQGGFNVLSPNSTLTSNVLYLGNLGRGQANISEGGAVITSGSVFASNALNGWSQVVIDGPASSWTIGDELWIGAGQGSTGDWSLQNGARLSASGRTFLGPGTAVHIDNARFEFGEMSLASFAHIGGAGGSLAGDVLLDAVMPLGALASVENLAIDTNEVRLVNGVRLYGAGTVTATLVNEGEVEAIAGERMRFAGLGNPNENDGEINNFDGQIRFDGALVNRQFIAGRGQFIAEGGWTNEGVLALSGGEADVLGDFVNSPGGSIVTAGGATTTFFDDVVHNGVELKTAVGSHTVFLGSVSGSGPFTGPGSVFMAGDLRPGNSPGVMEFGGDLALGSLASLAIELGGVAPNGEFDQVHVAGTLSLGGTLSLSLVNGFTPQSQQSFDILDWGSLDGAFDALVLPALAPGLAWNTSQLYTNGRLSVTSAFTADFDEDGDVDKFDLPRWQAGFGLSGSAAHTQGDADGDHDVDGNDFLVWQRQLGSRMSVPAGNAIPEPGAIILALLGVTGCAGARPRR